MTSAAACLAYETYEIRREEAPLVRSGPGLISPSGVVFGSGGILPESYHREYRGLARNLYLDCAKNLIRYGLSVSRSEPVLLFHNPWSGGYYHWLLEALPRLFALRPYWGLLPLVIPRRIPNSWFRHWLVEISGGKHAEQTGGLLVRDALLQQNPSRMSSYHSGELGRVKSYFMERLGRSRRKRRLYISRRSAGHRKLTNEHEIIDLLAKRGFEALELETLTFAEQLEAFSCAEVVVAIHGAGLSNALFMEPGTHVIELIQRPDPESTYGSRRRTHLLNPCYAALCDALGIHHSAVLGLPDLTSTPLPVLRKYGTLHANISIAVAELDSTLAHVGVD